MIGD
jgi:hypothetical protein